MSSPHPAAARRFAILAAPRTGSNWLCTLLDSHPQVLCHHELFNPEGIHLAQSVRRRRFALGSLAQRERDPVAFLERAWRRPCGAAAVGFKITRGQSQVVFDHLLAQSGTLKLVLERRNRVKTFVSEQLARATGHWESYPGVNLARPPAIDVDAGELARHAELNRQFYDSLRRRLLAGGQPALWLTYEELGQPQVQRRILAFLEVAPGSRLAPATRKQTPRDLRRVIANFDDLARQLAGTPLAAELASTAP